MSQDGRNDGVPPLMAGIVGAVVVLAISSKALAWIKIHEAEILGAIGWVMKGLILLGLIVALGFFIFRVFQRGIGWTREVSGSILEIQSEVDALDERHNYSRGSIAFLDRQLRAISDEMAELRKFTGFDEEIKRRQKLQQAMSSLGVPETPSVKEQDDQACAKGSEPAESY